MSTRSLPLWFALLACLASLLLPASAHAEEKDGKLKSWTTAELVGAMRWAKSEASERKQRLDFAAAEIICYDRMKKQIESGAISRTSAFFIAETVRKKGIYKGDPLTLDRAEELRRLIIGGKFLEALSD
jgi:hypothetical protein